jgi:hypothetical protein
MDRRWLCGVVVVLLSVAPSVASATDEGARVRAEASSGVAAIESSATHVRSLLQVARAQRNALEIACVNEKLTRVDVALRIGQDLAARAIAAWKNKERVAARVELAGLASRRDAARIAAREADACRPPQEVIAAPNERTYVRVIVDESLPDGVTDYPTERW